MTPLQRLRNLWRVLGGQPIQQKTYTMQSLFLTGKELPYADSADLFGLGGGVHAAYSNSWIAYACIRRLALDGAAVPLMILRDPLDPESEVDPTHPLAALFRRPNPQFSTGEFLQSILTWLQLRGEFFLVFDDPRRPREMIQYTEPRHWRHIVQGRELAGWEYQQGAQFLRRFPEEILHHRLIDPSNPWRGQPPLQAAADPYHIESGGDSLQRSIIQRGGERAILYESELPLTDEQREQALAALRARRQTGYQASRDTILPSGIKVIDPRFVEDDLRILEAQPAAADKICAVYGISKSLLGFEDIDKYATFQGRLKVYWHQTLLPTLRGVESAFDNYFATDRLPSDWAAYVRFDLRRVEALQKDLKDQLEIAGAAHKEGIPWAVLNERLGLGLDTDSIPGAETVMVSSTLAPIDALLAEWGLGPAPAKAAPDSREKAEPTQRQLTNADIIRRATDPRRVIQRNRRLARYEKQLRAGWKKTVGKFQRRAERDVTRALENRLSIREAQLALQASMEGLGEKLVELVSPLHKRAAEEGQLSIVELLDDKIGPLDLEEFRKAPTLRQEANSWIEGRTNLIVGMETDLFEDVMEHVSEAVSEGGTAQEVGATVRQRFQVSINRSITIARTEVGTAYNVSRFHEMRLQGFREHQWLTAGDELVRGGGEGDEFDHAGSNDEVRKVGETFPCGLTHPMEDGGDAGNVINCRCETVPFVRET